MRTGGDFFNFINFIIMFISRESAGMGEKSGIINQVKSNKSWETLLWELENIYIVSNTWLIERRNLIRSWSAEELIRAHTTLRLRITLAWSISYANRILLEAIEKEWTEEWWYHTEAIQISDTRKIHHGQGLTTTNDTGDTEAGFTRIAIWTIIKPS